MFSHKTALKPHNVTVRTQTEVPRFVTRAILLLRNDVPRLNARCLIEKLLTEEPPPGDHRRHIEV